MAQMESLSYLGPALARCPRVLRGTAGAVMRTADRCGYAVEKWLGHWAAVFARETAAIVMGFSHASERSTEELWWAGLVREGR